MPYKSPPPKVPQPNHLDEVYEALKKGLTAYLEVHQLELEKLSTQICESKRNSRLGFLYDLDEQVKSIKRFLRHLEFHTRKIDELYKAYCIQWRLLNGAHNMVKAYSTGSPGSWEARESLAEASKGYREYTENMCLLENELESQLGKFHVQMKGLAGFAQLCAGDQYEIFMKYGRQRWKLRGRIEVNSKQVWDSEEMVFLPLITKFLSIKVQCRRGQGWCGPAIILQGFLSGPHFNLSPPGMVVDPGTMHGCKQHLKSLANHVVMGSVSCETKDLFAALPQVVAVDINDLGTLKLSLEVTWNPFNKDDQPSAANTLNKASMVNKRFSTYNQSPPDTPFLREQAFYNMLRRQEEMENGIASISSESSDDSSSQQLPSSTHHAVHKPIMQPELQALAPVIKISFSQQLQEAKPSTGASVPAAESRTELAGSRKKEAVANGHVPYSQTLSHISEDSTGTTTEANVVESPWEMAPSLKDMLTGEQDVDPVPGALVAVVAPVQDKGAEAKPRASVWATTGKAKLVHSQVPAWGGCGTGITAALAQVSMEESLVPTMLLPIRVPKVPRGKVVDSDLEEAICLLGSALDDYLGQFPELQPLGRELKRLEEMLLQKQGIFLSQASSISLMVEHALESFSFLNTSNMENSEGSKKEPLQDERYTAGSWDVAQGRTWPGGCWDEGCPDLPGCPSTFRPAHHSSGQVQAEKQQDLALLEHLPYKDRLRTLGLFSLEKRSCMETSEQPYDSGGTVPPFISPLMLGWEAAPMPYAPGTCSFAQPSCCDTVGPTEFPWGMSSSRFPVLICCFDLSLVRRRAVRPQCGSRVPGASKTSADDTSMCSGSEASTDPLSTGNEFLDKALVLHLNNCNRLLLAKESMEQLVYLCQTDKEPVQETAKQSLMLYGEDGKSAHQGLEETLDSFPQIFAPASMASTPF
ncbi:LOW QUALITY PROTEIN: rho family-interacting cell polarization regulator 1-like [Guaruba guarouba]